MFVILQLTFYCSHPRLVRLNFDQVNNLNGLSNNIKLHATEKNKVITFRSYIGKQNAKKRPNNNKRYTIINYE